MDNWIRMLLLKYLDNDENIANLERAGYSYALIAKEYSKLINEMLIIPDENMEFILSSKGLEELNKLTHEFYDNKDWKIEPYVKHRIRKLSKHDIYIE